MFSFTQYLQEKLITFGGQAYPKFGNVVIMAGGAGSGKGFVKNKLVGIEGFVFDVDALKTIAASSHSIESRVQKELGVSLKQIASDLKNPENVRKLHEIIGDVLKLDDKKTGTFYKSILTAHPDRKPNIIFDVTLKDMSKLQRISSQVTELGYDKKNTHIVWVINDIEVAKAQNLTRSRSVPEEILINTHKGVSSTMQDIIGMSTNITKYLDGDIVFAFNKAKIDSTFTKSDKGGGYISQANYIYIKRQGETTMNLQDVAPAIKQKLAAYTPKILVGRYNLVDIDIETVYTKIMDNDFLV